MNTIILWIESHWVLLAEILAYYIIGFFVLFFFTFVFFAAVINFRNIRDSGILAQLSPSVTVFIKAALYLGLTMDALLNWVYLTAAFLELPREVLSTFRVKRIYYEGSGWRKQRAEWFGKNWLLPIDPHHLDK